ncbi:MAG: hypothetical protein LBT06_10450 [Hungatella sp.]|nr:hypothetical protein [Hungatella sp.]
MSINCLEEDKEYEHELVTTPRRIEEAEAETSSGWTETEDTPFSDAENRVQGKSA